MKGEIKEIIVILVIIFFMYVCISNNIDSYENNKISKDKPDDKLFFSCSHARYEDDSDYPFEEYPNSNYKIVRNSISDPLKGSYTNFKYRYNLSDNDDNFYHSPICERPYEFNDNYKLQFRNIIEDSDDNEYLIDLEKHYDSQMNPDPYYVEGNPEYIGNKIIYSPELKEKFLKIKLNMDKHHEDASHIHENYTDRYN